MWFRYSRCVRDLEISLSLFLSFPFLTTFASSTAFAVPSYRSTGSRDFTAHFVLRARFRTCLALTLQIAWKQRATASCERWMHLGAHAEGYQVFLLCIASKLLCIKRHSASPARLIARFRSKSNIDILILTSIDEWDVFFIALFNTLHCVFKYTLNSFVWHV